MRKGITVRLSGANVEATATRLGQRLIEMGHPVEQINGAALAQLGADATAAHVCQLLSRNGVIVIASYAGAEPQGERINADLDPNDTPDFAAEKVIDLLAEAGVVNVGKTDYSPEEEEQIKQRLADLGYIE